MNSFEFFFHQIHVRIQAESPNAATLVEQFSQDFGAFPSYDSSADPLVRLYFYLSIHFEAGARPALPFILSRNGKSIYGFGDQRVCLAQDVMARCWSEKGTRHFRIDGSNLEKVYEVTYLAILSALGEELDNLGFHRTHALAARLKGRNFILMAAPGLGKSALAGLLLREEQDLRLFSDEAPLLYQNRLYPYPLRLALHQRVADALNLSSDVGHRFGPKKLFSFPFDRQADPGKLDYVFFGRRTTGRGGIQSGNRWLFALDVFLNLVVGVGQVQMAEWMLRTSATGRLARSAWSRLLAFVRLLRSDAIFCRFDMVEDANENARAIKDFLQSQSSPCVSKGSFYNTSEMWIAEVDRTEAQNSATFD
jgi:hypothetical protein